MRTNQGRWPENIVSDILGPAHGGTVIARHDGHVVFVRGALPGEKGVHIRLDPPGSSKKASRFRTGVALDVDQPHPGRREGQCAAAAAGAGCCDLDFMTPEVSAKLKRDVVVDQLRRIGSIEMDPAAVQLHSVSPFTGWRTRARLGTDSTGTVGLRAKNSHAIIPVSKVTCAQWHPQLAEELRQRLPKLSSQVTPGAELAVAIGDDGQFGCVEVTHHRGRTGKVRRLSGNLHMVRRRLRVIQGGAAQTLSWSLPVESFWQGHLNAAQSYSDWIAAELPSETEENSVIWDLYGGAGVLAAAVHEHANAVDSVDLASGSTKAGEKALRAAGIDSVRFVSGDVSQTMEQLAEGSHLHAVIVDPPRTGMAKGVAAAITAHQPEHVMHVGCDPATAARDLKEWVAQGYRLEKLSVWDAYGLTHHVELIAHLTQAKS